MCGQDIWKAELGWIKNLMSEIFIRKRGREEVRQRTVDQALCGMLEATAGTGEGP